MIVQLFPLLCGLAAIGFSSCIREARQVIFLLSGFLLATVFIVVGTGNPWLRLVVAQEELAFVAAVIAFVLLRRHDWRNFGLVAGGAMAAFWMETLMQLGAGLALALVLASLQLGLCIWAGLYRENFVDERMLDEALLGIIALALLVGLAPAIIGGWQSAGTLQSLDTGSNTSEIGLLAVMLAVACTILGVCWAVFRNRRSVLR